jgi:hypothetical protein
VLTYGVMFRLDNYVQLNVFVSIYLILLQGEMEPTRNFDSRQEIYLNGRLKWLFHYYFYDQAVCINE